MKTPKTSRLNRWKRLSKVNKTRIDGDGPPCPAGWTGGDCRAFSGGFATGAGFFPTWAFKAGGFFTVKGGAFFLSIST